MRDLAKFLPYFIVCFIVTVTIISGKITYIKYPKIILHFLIMKASLSHLLPVNLDF